MQIKKLLYNNPNLIRPIIIYLGFKSLLKLLDYKSIFSLLIKYKVPFSSIHLFSQHLKILQKEVEVEDLDHIIKSIDRVKELKGFDPMDKC